MIQRYLSWDGNQSLICTVWQVIVAGYKVFRGTFFWMLIVFTVIWLIRKSNTQAIRFIGRLNAVKVAQLQLQDQPAVGPRKRAYKSNFSQWQTFNHAVYQNMTLNLILRHMVMSSGWDTGLLFALPIQFDLGVTVYTYFTHTALRCVCVRNRSDVILFMCKLRVWL